MLFSSPTFFVFFICFLFAYWLVPSRLRLLTIIVGSTAFYAWWHIEYVFVPYALALIGYVGALCLSRPASHKTRRLRLVLTVVLLFVPLAVFKYADFLFVEVLGLVSTRQSWRLNFLLPLGISFITFTICAYVVDVYRGVFPAERRLSRVLGFALFFPHLVAGPILRPRELMPQLGNLPPLANGRVLFAVAIFTVGLVKKLVFADQIAGTVEAIYGSTGVLSRWDYWLAIYGFSAQIYFDFSGYTDMAIGLASLLGVRLPNNFAKPYCADSVIEFWRRWHITLSHWLRDYLYIPLGGNKKGMPRRLQNLIVTMTIAGLWHGANWTFLIWGAVHGVAMALLHVFRWITPSLRIPYWLCALATFHFIAFAWILFRAPSMSVAWHVLSGAFAGSDGGLLFFMNDHTFVLMLLAIFAIAHRFDSHAWLRLGIRRIPRHVVWPVLVMLWGLAIAVSQGSSSNFIYFDF